VETQSYLCASQLGEARSKKVNWEFFRLVESPLLWAYMQTGWQLYLIGSDWRPAREISVPLITAIRHISDLLIVTIVVLDFAALTQLLDWTQIKHPSHSVTELIMK